jgi:hypothetical protein
MDRLDWIKQLAELVRPMSPQGAAVALAKMLPALDHEPYWVFDDASLQFVASRCRKTPTFGELKGLLDQWRKVRSGENDRAPEAPIDHAAARIERERDQWEQRQDELRAEWDDPDGIRARIRTCDGELRFLRLLAGLVNKWAPQHLGLLPPSAIASLQVDAGEWSPPVVVPPPVRAAYLAPDVLDQVNPLPGGRKRDATASTTTVANDG